MFELAAPSEIEMYVGETRDLLPYIVFSSNDRQVSFSSSDDSVAEVSGSVVRAVSSGNATVTVKSDGSEASIAIAVEYRSAATLEIKHDGDIVQNVNDITKVTPVIFSAETDDFIDPQAHIEWTVDGKAVPHDDLVLTPTRFGEYAVTAKLQDLTNTEYVKVYRATGAYGKSVGETDQLHDYSPVVFSAHENIDTRNPVSVVEWTVNGELASNNKLFEFTPAAQGEYEIELYVNGVKRNIDGKESVNINARGERAPSGKVTFDADGVYIKWSDGEKARSVVITDPDGVRTAYSSSDISCAYRFGDGMFDATGLITVTSKTPREYTVAVSAVALGEAEKFMQYGDDAREFIENKLLVNNSFIDSAERSGEFVLEMYVCGKTSARAYIARDVDKEKALSIARARASELGLSAAIAVDGNIMTVDLGEFINTPTLNAEPISERRMYSVLPHIEYNESNRRAANYALAIDRVSRTAEVSGSEQLLFAVMHGIKPLGADGSAAQTVYDNARRTLIAIIGKDYSDFRKVHAIYDYLQWCGYKADKGATGAQYSSNYLESMFFVYAADRRPPYTMTSLGAAKVFALLCGMEGIHSEIVPVEQGGTYYYVNSVAIDGARYYIDVYGGEYGMSASRELCTHERLLMDDVTARMLGVYEESDFGAIDGGRMYYLQKYVYGETYYDYYISAAEKSDYSSLKAAVFGAFDRSPRGEVSIFSITGELSLTNETFGAEFFLDAELSEADIKAIESGALQAVKDYANLKYGKSFRDDAVSVYFAGRTMHITAIMPKQNSAAE